MTTFERMTAMFNHENPDYVPIYDNYWESTLARWHREGMPADVSVTDYFGLDKVINVGKEGNILDMSPQFEKKIIEEGDNYIIEQNEWGQTKKNFKPVSSTFQHLDQIVKDRESWKKAKERMVPDRSRINWKFLEENYAKWRAEGAWLMASIWCSYDTVSTQMCNTETILFAMADDPEWTTDMFNTCCDLTLALLDMMWDAGYTFDEVNWPDDMSYKNGMLFSKRMWREQILPYQTRIVKWAREHDVRVTLHCCGNINSLVDELVNELGIDLLDPLEVKAGMDPIALKAKYGNKLAFSGGFDARNWSSPELVEADVRRILPIMMQNGGYIFKSDHSVPDSVSLEDYTRLVKLVREVGKY